MILHACPSLVHALQTSKGGAVLSLVTPVVPLRFGEASLAMLTTQTAAYSSHKKHAEWHKTSLSGPQG